MLLSVLAIDPGSTESAWVYLREGAPFAHGKALNAQLRKELAFAQGKVDEIAIETIASYGMPVGAEVFETCVWIGRFAEHARCCNMGDDHLRLYKRAEVKLHHCHSARANDATVRQAIIDRFGGKALAIGNKAQPGPLHGIIADRWSALAIALMWWDQHKPDGYRNRESA